MAESTNRTVRDLLAGDGGPLTGMEEWLWNRFWLAQGRLRQQAERAGGRR